MYPHQLRPRHPLDKWTDMERTSLKPSLSDEETHAAVLTAEGIILDDVVEATSELGHVESFEMYRIFNSAVGLADCQNVDVLRQSGS